MIIYKIINTINDKVYVGQTIKPIKKRWSKHLYDSEKLDYPIYKAMRKYGKENFSIKKIDVAANTKELDLKERFYINKLESSVSKNGYNIQLGGKDRTVTINTLKKISIKNKEAWKNPTYKENMKIKRKKSSLKRYRNSFNVYQAILLQRGGNQAYVYGKGKLIGKWDNQKPCCDELKLCIKAVSGCLNKTRKTHKGFMFEKLEECSNGKS